MKRVLALCIIVPLGFLGCRTGDGNFFEDPYNPDPDPSPVPIMLRVPTFECGNGTGNHVTNFYNTFSSGGGENPLGPSSKGFLYNGKLQFSIKNTSFKTIVCCTGPSTPTVRQQSVPIKEPNAAVAMCAPAERGCIEILPDASANYGLACVAGVPLGNTSINFDSTPNEVNSVTCSFPDTGQVAQKRLSTQYEKFTCALPLVPYNGP